MKKDTPLLWLCLHSSATKSCPSLFFDRLLLHKNDQDLLFGDRVPDSEALQQDGYYQIRQNNDTCFQVSHRILLLDRCVVPRQISDSVGQRPLLVAMIGSQNNDSLVIPLFVVYFILADWRMNNVNFFDALEWSNWKNLTLEVKQQLSRQLLMYFVNPLREITKVEFVQYVYSGIKCETFEVTIDGEVFVFIPGSKETIIGWDMGTQGISPTVFELAGDFSENKKLTRLITNYQLKTNEDWSIFVNESTSSLRKSVIPPMFVQKYSQPVGTQYLGTLATVSGEFTGKVEAFSKLEQTIKSCFLPPQSFEESLDWSLPEQVYQKNLFYAELDVRSGDYRIYQHEEASQESLKKTISKKGYDLLSEDQWEYVCGAGTRRLFRWGNQLLSDNGADDRVLLQGANMFGLFFESRLTSWEITEGTVLKMENWPITGNRLLDNLPFSSYYRSREILHSKELLAPDNYRYRKMIPIKNNA